VHGTLHSSHCHSCGVVWCGRRNWRQRASESLPLTPALHCNNFAQNNGDSSAHSSLGTRARERAQTDSESASTVSARWAITGREGTVLREHRASINKNADVSAAEMLLLSQQGGPRTGTGAHDESGAPDRQQSRTHFAPWPRRSRRGWTAAKNRTRSGRFAGARPTSTAWGLRAIHPPSRTRKTDRRDHPPTHRVTGDGDGDGDARNIKKINTSRQARRTRTMPGDGRTDGAHHRWSTQSIIA
jgi:hypothetical protein